MKNDRKFEKRWEKRRRGRWYFALVFAVVYALVSFSVLSLLDVRDGNFKEVFFSLIALRRFLIFFVLGFLLYAFFIWRMNEQRLKRIRDSKKKENGTNSEI